MKKSFSGGKSNFDKPAPRSARGDRPAYGAKEGTKAGAKSGFGAKAGFGSKPGFGAKAGARSARPVRADSDVLADPYKAVRRPRVDADDSDDRRPPRVRGSFTVTLDDDVAKVFRGDASVNKALRLVMQLTQVVAGPPRTGFGAGQGGQRRFERGSGGSGGSGAGFGAGRTQRTARFDAEEEE